MEKTFLDLSMPLRRVRGVGPRRSEALAAAGLLTVEDLLLTLPFRYEDRSRFLRIASLESGTRGAISGRILSPILRRTRVPGFSIFEIAVEDGSGRLRCVWFNQPYLKAVLREGRRVVLFGEAVIPERGARSLQLRNPQYEVLGQDPEGIHTGRIVPIYRRVGDLSTRRLRAIVHDLLESLPPALPDPLPVDVVRGLGLPPRDEAIREIHFPAAGTDPALLDRGLLPATRRLAFEELYRLQVSLARARQERDALRGIPCPGVGRVRQMLKGLLPFQLTEAQERSLVEITADLARSRPMSRLLQGDVGCGKTVVALLSALVAIESGCQAALMVPTEILAVQHLKTFGRILAGARYRLGVLTAGVRGPARCEVLEALSTGDLDLVIGTHALIQAGVKFRRLGLVIIDEQHRFGVRQRTRLVEKGKEPHLLMLTATPIPRSLALTLYGDLDLSLIDALPPGRPAVTTVLRPPGDHPAIYTFIRKEVERGGRAAIVYPLVRESQARELRAAVSESIRLSEGPFRGMPVGLLHGDLPPAEKSRVMEGFATGRTPILVTTTVVEVGVDVPEASIILVEHADRFGLAQLHQLRGRVGRGSASSWCILVPGERATPAARARLEVLTGTSDGFEIARRDLELRGPGELEGLRQSGEPDLKIADLGRDLDLLERARVEALRSRPATPPGSPAR